VGIAAKRIVFILSFLSYTLIGISQNDNGMGLQDALIKIAKQHKLSLIFNPTNLQDKIVQLPNKDWTVEKQLSFLLQRTNLSFEVEDEQIFLYRNHNIYGYIEDANTGERLISATIYMSETGEYDIANEAGYFTISTIKDSVMIEASYLGYSTKLVTIGTSEMDRPITIGLSPDNNLKEVVISDALVNDEDRPYIELNKGSDILLLQNQSSSAVGGEPDIFQALVRQSGVNSGPDGIGGIHIRGGRNDQNQVLYDGVRLYNSSHAFGVYSIINNSIIDQARLHKSGSRGVNSGRLSSVLDIKIKDPSLDKPKSIIQLSTMASQASIELPIVKDKFGMMLTGRRSHIDPYIKSKSRTKKQERAETGETNFYFDDINFKLYGKLSNNQRLYFSYYRATDTYTDNLKSQFFDYELIWDEKEESLVNWKNELAALRYNVILSSKTFANIQGSIYSYAYKNEFLNEHFDQFEIEPFYDRIFVNFETGIKTYDLRLDFQSHFTNHVFKYGCVASTKNYQGGILGQEDLPYEIDHTKPFPDDISIVEFDLGDYSAQEFTAYISDKFKWNKSVLLESGLYATYYTSLDNIFEVDRSSYFNLHGYLNALFVVSKTIQLGASLGTYIQNEHLLTVGDNGYPSDIWLPSTQDTPPEKAYQAEVFGEFIFDKHRLKASGYYKRQKGVVVLNFLPVLPSLTNLEADFWEEETILADAESVGLEADYRFKIKDKLTFRSVYTASYTDYIYDAGTQDEDGYPFEYSIPHTINLALNAKLMYRLRLSVDWYYASGRPHTLYSVDKLYSPIERPETGVIINQESEFYNDTRLPSIHKLSAALSTYWHWGSVKCDLTLGIQNIYNQRNLLYTYLYDDYYNSELRGQSAFPMMPIFKWRVEL